MKNINQKERVQTIFNNIPKYKKLHSLSCKIRNSNKHIYFSNAKLKSWHREIETYYKNRKTDKINIDPYADIIFPTTSVGNFNSDCFLHAPAEIVLRMFYYVNRDRYKTFFDVGANVGLDSLFGASLGWDVSSFEPDPYNFNKLKKNILLNNFNNIKLYKKAISNILTVTKFISVKGNRTASHIRGARGYYGKTDLLKIKTTTFKEIGHYPDLIKLHIEGHECEVLLSIPLSKWKNIDCIAALHSKHISKMVYDYFATSKINLFSQKIGWEKANNFDELALDYEGYIFISAKKQMNW